MLVTRMAGPIDTGQQISTYLFFHIIPIIIYHLSFHVAPEDPMSLRILTKTLAKMSVWRLRGHTRTRGAHPKNNGDFKKPKKTLVSKVKDTTTIKQKLPIYLVPALFAALKVGCRIKAKLCRFLRPFQRAPRFFGNPAVRFDLDSFLHLTNDAGEITEPLALNGEIPKKLVKVTPPKCVGCLFGAMTKIPWRDKEAKASHEVFIATKPGECVSIDQMASTEDGLFAQLKGRLTKRRYKCATIFFDHFSRLRFVHLQSDDSSEETIEAKRAFETFAAEYGVRIQHYHCDNGRFQDNAFKQACHDAQQQLTFSGVNAHFQNGIAERSIRDLSESAHKQLLHTRARWPQAVHFALWPYALCNAALLHNTLPVLEDGTSRLELFSSIHVGSNMKHVHTFGCPVFALQNTLASGKTLPR